MEGIREELDREDWNSVMWDMDAEEAGTCLKNKVPSAIDRYVPEFKGHSNR